MSKELIRLDASPAQSQRVHELFTEMMASSEASYGMERRRAGHKSTDWDAYVLYKDEPIAKL
jgi:hypothetical protein